MRIAVWLDKEEGVFQRTARNNARALLMQFLWNQETMKYIMLRNHMLAFLCLLSGAVTTDVQSQDAQTQSGPQPKELEERIQHLTQTIEELKARIPIETPVARPAEPKPSLQALTETATLAINSSTNTVANMEKVFSTANYRHNLLLTSIAAILTAIAIVGGLAGIQQFKHTANAMLDEKVTEISQKLRDLDTARSDINGQLQLLTSATRDITQSYEQTKNKIETQIKNSTVNIEALIHTATAYLNVTYVLSPMGAAGHDDKRKQALLSAVQYSAFDSVNDVIEKIKPTDAMLLSWAYTIRGTILHLQGKYAAALKDLETALSSKPDNNNAQYNAACAAARLGDKQSALRYIQQALLTRPERRTEALTDKDLELIWPDLTVP
ncbi:MAG: tetratricopeptide repeat protein [Pseudomonadota bacterium]|nr:hypothetical protein [Gammaproteobacteria bacterium]MDQ3580678.1 tetratricopeptide repeat protein [Pseudomonadota bacterium]